MAQKVGHFPSREITRLASKWPADWLGEPSANSLGSASFSPDSLAMKPESFSPIVGRRQCSPLAANRPQTPPVADRCLRPAANWQRWIFGGRLSPISGHHGGSSGAKGKQVGRKGPAFTQRRLAASGPHCVACTQSIVACQSQHLQLIFTTEASPPITDTRQRVSPKSLTKESRQKGLAGHKVLTQSACEHRAPTESEIGRGGGGSGECGRQNWPTNGCRPAGC